MPNYDDWGTSRRSPKYAPKEARGTEQKTPGRSVGVIAVQAKDYKPGDFNPLVLFWVVSKYRKDLNEVIDQTEHKRQLGKYNQSLFHSCFKNW